MSQLKRMLSGELYMAEGEELGKIRDNMLDKLYQYNHAHYNNHKLRDELIKEILGGYKDKLKITPPVYFDYGKHTFVGKNFYANFDCIFLDVNTITIGDNVMFGPRVGLYTAGHPIDKDVRITGLEYGLPITIGNNVWIGGNVVVMPGVHIGDNTIIGSGSVVTKDIPSDVIAAGNPCKVIRKITTEDKIYWEGKKKIYEESF
ncbi:sugar O-acetyltransferase [Acholeplasma laidlawii]|uniref:Acetyltransferase n=2 Tax=Acholeplasma laidlawii TaxID=2148 RepID=A9NE86_ACHLI|nr:sugar O-acetyltransferase [Acholeplasma laidlawii]ABX80666.1 galactoside O-acetyltransferase [Acholeplasma laidlawii PG-8A]NWH11027.1 sugar O-acetyltransferase [Acholeplasma laidlawii]NWH12413.1 sugar O-acetyltransferase [Acholeplasma laidlawii]NWH13799.1 sugar O-acetyltransferase [Acholeplasma laidlawii]NWH15099.1 sugar O-acetyltransferase [Acholeplasma laidlawii]